MSAHLDLGLAANDALLLALGYAALYGLGIARGRGAVRYAGLAYLVGWALMGITLSYALMAGVRFDLSVALLLAGGVGVAFLVAGRAFPRLPHPASESPRTGLTRGATAIGGVMIVVAAVCAAIVAFRSSWTPDYDTFAIWVPHAQAMYYGHGLWSGAERSLVLYHPEYPPLAPAMYALTFRFVGGFHPSLLPSQQYLLALAFVGSALVLLDRCVPRWIAVSSTAMLLVAPEFFRRIDSLLPDQTLAYLVATAALACVLWLRERRTAWLVLSVVLSVAATLTKLEGVTYAFLLALVVCGGAALLRDRRTALPALALFIGVAAIEPWRLWLSNHRWPTSSSDYQYSTLLHPGYLAHRLGRILPAVDWVLRVSFRPDQWLLVLPLALIGIVVVARRVPLLALASATWLVLAFAGLVVVYWIGQFYPFSEQDELNTSAYRVAGTIVIVAGVMLPLLLGFALERRPHREGRGSVQAISRT